MTATKKTSLFCFGITVLLYASILLWGILYPENNVKFEGAAVLFFFVMPAISFVVAMMIGIKNVRLKWLYPAVVAVLAYFINVVTIPTGSRIPGLFCVATSIIGLGIGLLVRKHRSRK